MCRRWDSDRGISQSRHSRRMVPITRSQIAFVIGLRGGVFNILTPSRPTDSSRCLAKNAIAIVKQVLVSLSESNGLAQLLQRPGGTWMGGDVAVDQAPAVVLDHHEYVQQPERCGDGNKEVAGNDSLRVKAQKCRPAQVASRSAGWT